MKRLLLTVLTGIFLFIGNLANSAYGAITAYVTLSDFACYSSQNSGHAGELIILHSTAPNSMEYDGVAGRLTITGNVANAPVVLSYTSGYFTCVFNDQVLARQATGTSTSPINFFTSTGNLSNGATFNINISCSVPDLTPPSKQSAATNSGGNQVIITFDESVESSYADVTEFTVKVGGSAVNVTGVSFSGTDVILTLQNAVTSGQTVTVSYNNTSDGLCDDNFNAVASFSDYNVTNNSTVVGGPTVTSVSVPLNNTYIAGQVLTFTVNFSEAINVVVSGGTPFIPVTLNNGGTLNATYASGSSTTALVFTCTVGSGNYDPDGISVGSAINANGGTLKSGGGANASLTLLNVGSTSNVLVDAINPTVSGVSVPANGTFISGQNMDFRVSFNESVTVVTGSGTPYLNLVLGTDNVQASYISGSGTSVLLFRHTVANGDLDSDGISVGILSANGGEVRDAAGNAANLTLNSVENTGGVFVDGIAPTVFSVGVPANATYISGQNLDFSINFSEAVTVNTAGGTPLMRITMNSGGTVNATYHSGSGSNTLVFRYTVVAGNEDADGVLVGPLLTNGGTIKDGAGNSATLTLNSVGSTSAVLVDGIIPTISGVNSTKPDGTYGIGESIVISVTFSEVVQVTGTPQLELETGVVDRSANYSSGSGTNVLNFTYVSQSGDESNDLDYKTTSSLKLNGGTIRDIAGNGAVLTLASPASDNSLGANNAIAIAAYPMVSLSVGASEIIENAGTSSITAILSEISSQDVAVSLSFSGTATFGTDYNNTISSSITIPAGNLSASASLGVTAFQDAETELNETIIVDISSVSKGIENGVQQKTITIIDDDAPLAPTAGSNTYTYDGTVKTALASVNAGETIVWYATATGGSIIAAPSESNAGVYEAYAEAKHIVTGIASASRTLITLTITKATLTVTADPKSKVYGDANPLLTFQYSGWKNTDSETVLDTKPTASTAVDLLTNVGTYTNAITLAGGSDNNYAFSYVPASMEITKAELTVRADNQSKIYGSANPPLTIQYSGWKNGDDADDLTTRPIATTTVLLNSPVGIYSNAITVSGGIDENYNMIYVSADFEIYKQTQTISFGNLSAKRYGDAPFLLSATASSGLPVTFAVSNPEIANVVGNTVTIYGVGTVTITASQNGNSTWEPAASVTQVLTVNRRPLHVNGIIAASKVYDGTTSADLSGGTLFGVIGTDQVVLENAKVGKFVRADVGNGIYISTGMTISGKDVGKYELVEPGGITANILRKEITVTANNVLKECHSVEPELTYTFSPNLSGNDSFSGSLTRESGTEPGSYKILQGTLALSNNYLLAFKEGTFSIVDNAPVWITKTGELDRIVEYNNIAELTAAQKLEPVVFDVCDQEELKVQKEAGKFEPNLNCEYTGKYTNTWTVTDSRGNRNVYTQTITVADRTAPVVEVWPSVQFTVPAGVCETEITYPEFKIIDTCIEKTELISGLGKNGKFPLGTTNETWKVTDQSGNYSFIKFAVTVYTPNIAPGIDQVSDLVVLKNSKQVEIPLSGIDPRSGCQHQEILSVTAEAENTELIREVRVEYEQGASTGKLILKIADNSIGESEIRVRVKDNGGTNNNGSDTKKMIFTLKVEPVTGVIHLTNDFDVKVYPNPCFGKVNIEVSGDVSSTLRIYSITGAEVYNKEISSDLSFDVDLSNNLAGIYFVEIRNAQGAITKKLILRK